jgi:hypothetical protein
MKFAILHNDHKAHVKLFDTIDAFVSCFSKKLMSSFDPSKVYDPWLNNRDCVEAAYMELRAKHLPTSGVSNVKPKFRVVGDPTIQVASERAGQDVKAGVADYEARCAKHFCHSSIDIALCAQIEISLTYTESVGEVKKPGEVYQPATTRECCTPWCKVYIHRASAYKSVVSIDATEKPRRCYGDNYETKDMKCHVYYHRISNYIADLVLIDD